MRIGDGFKGSEPLSLTAWIAAAGVLSLGLAMTGGAVLWQQHQARAQARVQLTLQAERLEAELVRRLTLPAYGLKGLRGSIAAGGGPLSHAEFQAYVKARDLPNEFPGTRGFGFIEPVTREALPALLAARRLDGQPGFELRGAGPQDLHYVITQIEPLVANRAALGLDVGAEPVRRQAIEQAVATGETTLSGPVTLVQDARRLPGFLLLVPVFQGADPTRRGPLQGLLFAPLVSEELLRGATDIAAATLDLRLSVRTQEDQLLPLLGAQGGRPLGPADAADLDLSDAPLVMAQHFQIAGRDFRLEAALGHDALAQLSQGGSLLALGGSLLSLLLAAIVYLLAAARARAEALARGMTVDLQRLAMVVRHTTNAALITDTERRITWVNDGYTRTTGYGAEEAQGRRLRDLVEDTPDQAATVQRLSAALDAGQGCQAEISMIRKDGERGWLDFEIQPLRDGSGTLTGFMAIGSDIHARKQAEQALAQERNRYAGILAAQTDLISRSQADGTITYANDAFCRFFGLPAEALIGRPWAPVVHADDLDRVRRELAVLSPEQPVVTIENRVLAADGSVHWVQFINQGMFDAAGRLLENQSVGRDISVRKRLEAQVQEASESLQDLYDNAPCAYYALDAQGLFISVNAMGLSWLECEPDELLGRCGPADFFTEEGRRQFSERFHNFKAGQRITGMEFDLTGRRGTQRRVSLSASAIFDSEQRFLRSRSVMFDITETHRIRQQLQQLTQDQEAMLDNDLVGIAKTRARTTIWRNRALERMFGYAEGELLNTPTRLLYPDDETHQALGVQAYPVLQAGERFRTQLQMRRKDGTLIWVDLSGVQLPGGDHTSMWMMVDISQAKAHEARMERAALHDALTGLPNRMLLADRLDQALRAAQRSGHALTLAYLDLNGFKLINDSFGHDAGDEVLKTVAARLQAALRASDTVARLGGDEFIVLLSPADTPIEGGPVMSRLLASLAQPITLSCGEVVAVGASLGLAHYPANGRTADALMLHADAAMYAHKRAGRIGRTAREATKT